MILAASLARAADLPSPETVHIDVVGAANTIAGQAFEQQAEKKQQQFKRSIHLLENIPEPHDHDAAHHALIILGDAALNAIEHWPRGYDILIAVHVSPSLFAKKQRLQPPDGTRISALFSGAPIERQLRLAKLILPRAHQLIIPYRSEHQHLLDAMLTQDHADIVLEPYLWEESADAIKTLQPLLRNTDAILALNALGAITPESIRGILLSAYRQGKPVIGMDAAYVRAGVLATTDTSLEQYSLETERMIRQWLSDGHLPSADYPRLFSVHINTRVAQSLNLVLPDEQSLTDRLLTQEAAP
ncbi:MAG TPA: ABC transporter substrate binding protein [Pseudomonadales bacterium]|jgi:ABC-type uncharacterized transport system substrate-binding protein